MSVPVEGPEINYQPQLHLQPQIGQPNRPVMMQEPEQPLPMVRELDQQQLYMEAPHNSFAPQSSLPSPHMQERKVAQHVGQVQLKSQYPAA